MGTQKKNGGLAWSIPLLSLTTVKANAFSSAENKVNLQWAYRCAVSTRRRHTLLRWHVGVRSIPRVRFQGDNVVSYTILRGLPPVLFHGGTAFECKQSHKVTQNKTCSAQCISQQVTSRSARNPCIGCVQQTDVCSIALLPLYFCILHTLLSQTRNVFPWKIPMAFHGES